MYVVEQGYIAIGSQVDQAKDFTAVSGYKQLCISINGKDECGFGKWQAHIFEQLDWPVCCNAGKQYKHKIIYRLCWGTPSLLSAVNPNLQAGVDQTINPQLYNNGITRVCATNNPGKAVLPNGQYDTTNSTLDRWQDVGFVMTLQ